MPLDSRWSLGYWTLLTAIPWGSSFQATPWRGSGSGSGGALAAWTGLVEDAEHAVRVCRARHPPLSTQTAVPPTTTVAPASPTANCQPFEHWRRGGVDPGDVCSACVLMTPRTLNAAAAVSVYRAFMASMHMATVAYECMHVQFSLCTSGIGDIGP